VHCWGHKNRNVWSKCLIEMNDLWKWNFNSSFWASFVLIISNEEPHIYRGKSSGSLMAIHYAWASQRLSVESVFLVCLLLTVNRGPWTVQSLNEKIQRINFRLVKILISINATFINGQENRQLIGDFSGNRGKWRSSPWTSLYQFCFIAVNRILKEIKIWWVHMDLDETSIRI